MRWPKLRLSSLKLVVLLLVGWLAFTPTTQAAECKENPCDGSGDVKSCLEQAVNACESSINAAKQEQQSLQSAINILDGNITLQQIQIDQTLFQIQTLQTEIADLSERIGGLNLSLDQLSAILVKRVGEQYKRTQTNPVFLLFKGNTLNSFLAEYKYLQLAKEQTLEAMQKAESQRLVYDEQKSLKEIKQDELESIQAKLLQQRASLDAQKQEKANLLAVTQHDESRYQAILSEAEKELQALISAQFSGKSDVGQGEILGYMGSTGFSTGPHLHFSLFNMSEGDNDELFSGSSYYFSRHLDPFSILQSQSVTVASTACNGIGGGNHSFGSGGNPWPMSSPYITQCYGNTPHSYAYSGNFHRGADIVGQGSLAIKTVKSGVAYFYRGATSLGNHVRVYHDDGTMTLYAHMQ